MSYLEKTWNPKKHTEQRRKRPKVHPSLLIDHQGPNRQAYRELLAKDRRNK